MTFNEYLDKRLQLEDTGFRGRYMKRVSNAIYQAFFPAIRDVLMEKKEGTFVFKNAPAGFFSNLMNPSRLRLVANILMMGAGAAALAFSRRPDLGLVGAFTAPMALNYVSRLFQYAKSYKVQTPPVDVMGKMQKIGGVSVTLVVSPKHKGVVRTIDSPQGEGSYDSGGQLDIMLVASTETPIEEIRTDLARVIEHEVTHKYQSTHGDRMAGNSARDYEGYRQEPAEVEAHYQEFKNAAKRAGMPVGNLLQKNLFNSEFSRENVIKTMRLYIQHAMKYYPDDVFYQDKTTGPLKAAEALARLGRPPQVAPGTPNPGPQEMPPPPPQ